MNKNLISGIFVIVTMTLLSACSVKTDTKATDDVIKKLKKITKEIKMTWTIS